MSTVRNGRTAVIPAGGTSRWERATQVAVGVGFGCGAVGNLVGFVPRAEELLPWFADTAWLPPYSWVIRRLVQVAPLVVTVSAAFELTVAAMLVSRRRVPLALGLATAWTLGLTPAVGWPYCVANVLLGSALAWLWVRASRSSGRPLVAQR